MIRTFNYTNRKKVTTDHVEISVKSAGETFFFDAVLKKEGLRFPEDAAVYIEAYYGPTYQRFSFGTFGSLQQPENTDITAIRRLSDKVFFRLKIADPTDGRILGLADKLSLANEADRGKESIFYVNAIDMDTREVWRVNFEAAGDGTPVLEVNKNIDGIREIVRSDSRFLSLVYPAAIRIILNRLANDGNFSRDGLTWQSKWLLFTENVLGISTAPQNSEDDESVRIWIDDVVRAFCIRYRLYEQFIKLYSA